MVIMTLAKAMMERKHLRKTCDQFVLKDIILMDIMLNLMTILFTR